MDDRNVGAWQEIGSPTSSLLAELNPTGTSTLSTGQSLSLGTPYAFEPAAFGDSTAVPLTFSYASKGKVVAGLVEFVGKENDFVVTVDPATGRAVLENQSSFFSADLIGYSIASASGSLRPQNGAWQSLDDAGVAGWDEAHPTTNLLSEESVRPDDVREGAACRSGRCQRISARLSPPMRWPGEIREGRQVRPCRASGHCCRGQDGDTDGDGDVDLNDLNNVRNFGSNNPTQTRPEGRPGQPGRP
jgi:hypothetical protein